MTGECVSGWVRGWTQDVDVRCRTGGSDVRVNIGLKLNAGGRAEAGAGIRRLVVVHDWLVVYLSGRAAYGSTKESERPNGLWLICAGATRRIP